MDNQKLILFFALSFILLLLWQAWQQDYGPQPTVSSAVTAEDKTSPPATPEDIPEPAAADGQSAMSEQFESTPAVPAEAHEALDSAQRVHVVTDLLDVEIDTLGGDIRQADPSGHSKPRCRPS